jgi:hypothetical protein
MWWSLNPKEETSSLENTSKGIDAEENFEKSADRFDTFFLFSFWFSFALLFLNKQE